MVEGIKKKLQSRILKAKPRFNANKSLLKNSHPMYYINVLVNGVIAVTKHCEQKQLGEKRNKV